ncbi:hypothetical protein PIB30_045737 [Stylosanthes scabra]|uniref:Uncharacterized protein n=1 Tax=Stylosanthes scabra TaxID=79078 RepID=A0ABU6ZEZ1_9FABA|nr:hypothetical protein [Stylosanthes scabra]
MTRGDRGRGRGDRGRGTGHRGRPKKRTGIPLDLGEPAAGTLAPTPVPVEGEGEDIALEEELARQAGRIYLRWDGVGIRYGRAQPRSPGSSTITTGSLCPSSVWPVMRWSVFCGTVGGLSFAYSAGMRAGSTPLGGRDPPRDFVTSELKRLQAERQALMEAGCPEPPPIDEAVLWTRFAGGRKRGRIYGMGVVPSHQHPPLFPDDEDADTASAPDLRERTQSQEVSDLRKAYVDIGGSSSAPLPDFPPPPPPPPPPQTDAPGTGPGTGFPDADDDPDYV